MMMTTAAARMTTMTVTKTIRTRTKAIVTRTIKTEDRELKPKPEECSEAQPLSRLPGGRSTKRAEPRSSRTALRNLLALYSWQGASQDHCASTQCQNL